MTQESKLVKILGPTATIKRSYETTMSHFKLQIEIQKTGDHKKFKHSLIMRQESVDVDLPKSTATDGPDEDTDISNKANMNRPLRLTISIGKYRFFYYTTAIGGNCHIWTEIVRTLFRAFYMVHGHNFEKKKHL